VPSDPGTVARDVLALADRRAATLGNGRLVVIDGPAGSGKTTLTAALAGLAPGSPVVHTDELLEGWAGLPGLAASVERLLRPLAAGRSGTWRRWDWHAGAWAESHEVAAGPPLLVVEGTGSWCPAVADLVTVLVWVEAPSTERLERGLARDGEAMRPHWERWRLEEDELHGRFGTRARADVVVDTAG
jgi:uridine kinase